MLNFFRNLRLSFYSGKNSETAKFLVVGAHGRLGNLLVKDLEENFAAENVVGIDTMKEIEN